MRVVLQRLSDIVSNTHPNMEVILFAIIALVVLCAVGFAVYKYTDLELPGGSDNTEEDEEEVGALAAAAAEAAKDDSESKTDTKQD